MSDRMDELRFCVCGFSFKQGDPSDPMTWHKGVGIHKARVERQRFERNEANMDAALADYLTEEE